MALLWLVFLHPALGQEDASGGRASFS
ncbi:MAG: hypothetical protein K0Q55_2841, partial [Verrucomicrobia bacterium]|nr:hypothetical protein [Verrucomicrobiota bacterium]